MAPENMQQKEHFKAAWYAPLPAQLDSVDWNDQIRVVSVAETGRQPCPVIVTCGEKQVLTTLEAPTPDCTETTIFYPLTSISRTGDAPRADSG